MKKMILNKQPRRDYAGEFIEKIKEVPYIERQTGFYRKISKTTPHLNLCAEARKLESEDSQHFYFVTIKD